MRIQIYILLVAVGLVGLLQASPRPQEEEEEQEEDEWANVPTEAEDEDLVGGEPSFPSTMSLFDRTWASFSSAMSNFSRIGSSFSSAMSFFDRHGASVPPAMSLFGCHVAYFSSAISLFCRIRHLYNRLCHKLAKNIFSIGFTK